MNFFDRPSYIEATIVGAPMDFVWDGAQAHIGPVETVTPLMKHLGRCTGLAEVGLCAGVLLWGTWRLSGIADNRHHLELGQAAFAYGVDWRYVDPNAGPDLAPPDQPPAVSATMKLGDLMRRALDHDTYWNSFYIPVGETFHSANIVSHILSKDARRQFERWLTAVSDRMHTHFRLPDIAFRKYRTFENEAAYDAYVAPRRGVAVPPQLLDPDFAYDESQYEPLMTAFVSSLNPANNRYLRSAKAMAALGFQGDPYPGA